MAMVVGYIQRGAWRIVLDRVGENIVEHEWECTDVDRLGTVFEGGVIWGWS
jgi:hypothetical protein